MTEYNPKNPDEFRQEPLPEVIVPPLNIIPSPTGSILEDGDFSSPNFRHSQSGWRVTAAGEAEFQSITANISQTIKNVIAGENLSAHDAVYIAPSSTASNIAFDAATGGSALGAASLTYTHTCTGSNRILFVSAFSNLNTGNAVSGVTYAAVAMTKIGASISPNNQEGSLWYLVAPATGANSVVVTQGNAGGSIRSNSSSYTGARQPGGQPDNSTTNTNSGTSITATLSTIFDNCWTIMLAEADGASLTAGTGSTSRNIQGGVYGIFDSNGAKTPAGSTSMTVTASSGNNGVIMASFRPVPTEPVKAYQTSAGNTRFSDAFLGLTNNAATIETTANVVISGLVSGFSGLTIGTKYYLSDTKGAISSSAGTITRKVAMAASETEILITNIW